MSAIGQGGVEIEVPRGWDGGVHLRVAPVVPPVAEVLGAGALAGGDLAPAEAATGDSAALVTVHAATFPLPPVRGDYGSGAVETMGAEDVFVSLLEFGASSTGSALFSQAGLVLPLDPEAFTTQQLQRPQRGQGGLQVFFTEAGRSFCAYVVIGSWAQRHRLVPLASELLAGLRIAAG
ncbi:MAG: hypothetical protein GEV08_13940 [Acidimicrobiia bacterium]|nr:hypothetical protein [Acidimicrobiia bacterium]